MLQCKCSLLVHQGPWQQFAVCCFSTGQGSTQNKVIMALLVVVRAHSSRGVRQRSVTADLQSPAAAIAILQRPAGCVAHSSGPVVLHLGIHHTPAEVKHSNERAELYLRGPTQSEASPTSEMWTTTFTSH